MRQAAESILTCVQRKRQMPRCHALLLMLLAQAAIASPPASLDLVIASIDQGQFKQAETMIASALAQTPLAAEARTSLEFQRERMRRILLDFTLDADAVKTRVRERIADLNDAEFARWDAMGLFEHQLIDGKLYYFNRSPSNLFRLSAEARARAKPAMVFNDGPMERANDHHREVIDAALAGHASSVVPRHLEITQSISVNADAVPAGETVSAWIPYPRALPGQQENIRLIGSEPSRHQLAPESAMQRTVYLEKPAVAGKPTVFSVSYALDVFARYVAVDADKVVAATITDELAPFVAERAPHVLFTESIRLLSRQIVGDEKNPWRITQKLYAAVDQVPWAGAREYSTISNISGYALHAGHADCGQQTLLLITLLRYNGIPARWQSGMVYSDGDYSNLHDWGQVYIAPYGWIPMDVTAGRLDSTDPAIANFYLGGQDAYRIAFNDDYGQLLIPAKRHFRSETVDLQRGEAEWSGGNLYFDQWDYDFTWQVKPAAPEKP